MGFNQACAVFLTLTSLLATSMPVLARANDVKQFAHLAGWPECLMSVARVARCAQEVYSFFQTGKNYPRMDCCEAVLSVEEQCWASFLVPGGLPPGLVHQLNSYCTFIVNTPSAPAPGKMG
ncbi:hypothetical protein AMTRI_Chr02g257260 [Amborella trichopoda]|uniref:Prolamin-like domain-containing protein n=1 Tax=Amborella trichopoda TaxID=13333 RepID=U5D1Z2_AMBTC|nr:hypothetical protein AMTR_s00062p00141690 [Amborella trichopoda]